MEENVKSIAYGESDREREGKIASARALAPCWVSRGLGARGGEEEKWSEGGERAAAAGDGDVRMDGAHHPTRRCRSSVSYVYGRTIDP